MTRSKNARHRANRAARIIGASLKPMSEFWQTTRGQEMLSEIRTKSEVKSADFAALIKGAYEAVSPERSYLIESFKTMLPVAPTKRGVPRN